MLVRVALVPAELGTVRSLKLQLPLSALPLAVAFVRLVPAVGPGDQADRVALAVEERR